MNKELREKCLTRWGTIPTDENWVNAAMEKWDGEIPDGYVTESEKHKKETLRHYLTSKNIVYIG